MAMNPYLAAGGGMMAGAGLGQMFAPYKNPASAGMSYMNQIPAQLQKYLGPYIDAGTAEIPGLTDQYNQLMTDPGARLNQIGAGYQQSPGFDFAMQQSLQGANNAAAAGGMAGSPQHEQQNMTLATNLADQDYNQWMSNALGLYKTGLSGGQDIYNTGAKTSMAMGEDMASVLASQAQLAYAGANAQNQHSGGMWGSMMGGLGELGAMAFL